MDKLMKARRVKRRALKTLCEDLEKELTGENPETTQIEALKRSLDERYEEVRKLDAEIFDLLLEEGDDEEDLNKEQNTVEQVVSKFNFVSSLVNKVFKKEQADKESETSSKQSSSSSENAKIRKYKLPTLEFRKFGGELKEWVPFWAQFSKIDQDDTLEKGDKFQYLIQATKPGSRARRVIESYPPSGENYEKAVKAMKERFGREELLIEVYVRELIGLIIHNSHQGDQNLGAMYDQLEAHLRALEALKVSSDCAAMLYPMVESCLPEPLIREWQRRQSRPDELDSPTDHPDTKDKLKRLRRFIRAEVEGEELVKLAVSGFQVDDKRPPAKKEIPTATELFNATKSDKSDNCIFCNGSHLSTDCRKALAIPYDQKRLTISKKGCCYKCLKFGHLSKACHVKLRCSRCSKGHASSMCYAPTGGEPTPPKTAAVNNVLANITASPQVLLQTVDVMLKSPVGGKPKRVKALFDSGAQRSYIRKEVVQNMGYVSIRVEELTHALFSGMQTRAVQHSVYRIHVCSIGEDYHCNFEVLDQEVICDYREPTKPLKLHTDFLELDSKETQGPIDILIGADIMAKLLTGNSKKIDEHLLAIETALGWTALGRLDVPNRVSASVTATVNCLTTVDPISQLWELETIGIKEPSTQATRNEKLKEVKTRFERTVERNVEGRYSVRLPWLADHPPLPTNLELTEKRTYAKFDRLKKQKQFDGYMKVFLEWEQEGIIEQTTDEIKGHYLPHRPVFKTQSTTKIRPVFDASARSPGQPSLNTCLEIGENLIEKIPNLLIKFRQAAFGISADIRKAFLQIEVHEDDRDYLRFLLEINGQPVTYRHKRVVFGVCSSPFLLGAVIEHHLSRATQTFNEGDHQYDPKMLEKLRGSFYVDNCVTSVQDKDEAKLFRETATQVMAQGRFDLRQWVVSGDKSDGQPFTMKILGLKWDVSDDALRISPDSLKTMDVTQVTKRVILSVTQRVFDPIGFVSPVLLLPKRLLQEVWRMNLKWDEDVPMEIAFRFRQWYQDLTVLFALTVPRWIFGGGKHFSIHVFCDASKDAYAAAIFVRIKEENEVKVHLVASKSRVSPLKQTTIPRLELLGALIAVRLFASVREALDHHEYETYFWSDSTTAITWIKRAEPWSVFVRNRVEEIRKVASPEKWHHVPGELNPADLPSRGASAEQLLRTRWWEGPNWLKEDTCCWPQATPEINEKEVISERKKTVMACADVVERQRDTSWAYRYFSSYKKMVRMIAWMFRFKHNCQPDLRRRSGEITAEEFSFAEERLFLAIQQETFSKKRGQFKGINVFTDETGLLRVKTKLGLRDDAETFLYPIVLPSRHPVIMTLLRQKHRDNQHLGVQTLLNLLRERFWLTQGRRTVKTVVRQCTVCRRYGTKSLQPPLADLPIERVRDAAPFESVGIDLAGPLYLKTGEKAWVCLFTCALVRAVHLELVESLSTNHFLLALRRFIARRGRPAVIFTDNGTNFVGAYNALKSIDWEEIGRFSADKKIVWKFIPPAAPWWGGWWERLVGMVKQLLRKVLGRASVTHEELTTLLYETEALINERPLTHVSGDPNDLTPLTPALLLNQSRSTGVPDLDRLNETNADCLDRRMRYLTTLKGELTKRFRCEYLSQLVQPPKERKSEPIKEGELVLVGQDNAKRMDWPLARVIQLIPGKDGKVRVVRLKTANGELIRPLQRIFSLEVRRSEEGTSPRLKADKETGTMEQERGFEISHPVELTDSEADDEQKHGFERSHPTKQTRSGRAVITPVKLDL